MKKKDRVFYNLTKEELENISDKELEIMNQKVDFVHEAMPSQWLHYAEKLFDDAELLWQHGGMSKVTSEKIDKSGKVRKSSNEVSSVSQSYILLCGFALENVLKGLIISENPTHITMGKISNNIKSHNLLNLVDSVQDLKLTRSEKRICSHLQEAIPYWGRYPVPLNYAQLSSMVNLSEKDHTIIINLINRTSTMLYEKIKKGWDSGVGCELISMQSERYGDKYVSQK